MTPPVFCLIEAGGERPFPAVNHSGKKYNYSA